MTRFSALCALSTILLALGCDEPAPDDETGVATFEQVFQVLDHTGCASTGCHGGDTITAQLDLDGPEIAHAQLVDVQCANTEANAAGLFRVAAGDSAASFLITKLAMTHVDPTLGLPMPPTGELLSDADLALVRAWIDSGAAGPDASP